MTILSWLRISSAIGFLYSVSSFGSTPLQLNVDLASFSEQLSQPTITAIHKDTNGFLWIGTQSGLNRYDGSRVTIFNSNDSTKHWVPASDISQIAEGPEGSIWVATYGGGLATYSGTEQTFEAVPNNAESSYTFLKSLLISRSGMVWFGTRGAGIGMYDPKLQRYAAWVEHHPLNHSMGQPSDILEDLSGRIWASGNSGLYLIDPSLKSITLYPLPTRATSNNPLLSVTAITEGPSGTIWLGTSEGELIKFDIQSSIYEENETLTDFAGDWIVDLVYEGNNLWIATDNGLTITNHKRDYTRTFTRSNSALLSDLTICLLSDGESILVGTARGLNVFSYSYFEKYQSNNSQLFDDVSSFTEDSNHRIWVGTFNGVFRLDEQNQVHSSLEDIYGDLALNDRRVTTLSIKDNEIWLGYFRGGVEIVDLTGQVSRTPGLPNNSELAVTKIIHTENGHSWIGTYNQGLFRIAGQEITSYYNNANSELNIPELTIMFVIKTGIETILVASETALYQIETSTGKVRPIELLLDESKPQPVILSVAKNRNGDVWFGLKDLGLFVWHPPNRVPDTVRPKLAKGSRELPSNTIYAIEFDEDGNAWVSTTGGISKLDGEGELIKNYTSADGLQGNDFNFASSFRDSQGRLYFGGSNGYNRFDPGKDTKTVSPSPVVLTDINIAGQAPQLPVAVHKLEGLELAHEDYFLTIEFSVLDFTDPESNRYRYRLENFDPEWIENGTRNTATYTNLPSGIYTFYVQGANSAGVWNREGTSLRIVVHPAFWWSWQAYLFYFAVLTAFIFAVKKYYDNNILREKAAIMTREAHDVADRATDQLQEQLEYQDEFVKIVHAHSVSTLDLIGDFITHQAGVVEDELTRDSILGNTRRVAALVSLEGCLFYQGDQLLANMESFTNTIIAQLLEETPHLASSVTTINEMPSRLIPVELATPLSIVLFELLQNCFHHAFESSSRANYIHISFEEISAEDEGKGKTYKLSIKDSGVGIPGNISLDHIETSGLAIVSSITRAIGGKLIISNNQGTIASVMFPSQLDII